MTDLNDDKWYPCRLIYFSLKGDGLSFVLRFLFMDSFLSFS